MIKQIILFVWCCAVVFVGALSDAAPPSESPIDVQSVYAPVVLAPRQSGVILMPDGSLKRFVTVGLGEGKFRNFSLTSADGITWGNRKFEFEGLRANLCLLYTSDAADE